MKILELFSGTECISEAFRRRGHEAFTIDKDSRFNSSWHIDIANVTAEDILQRFGKPDVIWAAFDCTTFSVAAIYHHRRQNPLTKSLDPITDYARYCDMVDQHVLKLIEELDPKLWFIENPRGALRKMEWMQPYNRYTTTYCQYGDKRMKPTDFWSNIDPELKPPCRNGDPCHEAAPRGSKSGTQALKGSKERSQYPDALCEHIVDICEKHIKEK